MAFSLLGYFFSMTTVLGVLMMLLNGIIGDSAVSKVRHQPSPMPMFAAASGPSPSSLAKVGSAKGVAVKTKLPSNTPGATEPAPAQPAAAAELQRDSEKFAQQKVAQQKQARERQRRLAARQREQRNAMLALGYAAQPSQSGTTFQRFWN